MSELRELCGSFGCVLPKGHNMGKPDVPTNHQPPTRELRAACEHEKFEPHAVHNGRAISVLSAIEIDGRGRGYVVTRCQGGSPVEGEKVWWCVEHRTESVKPSLDGVGKSIIGVEPPPYCWYWFYLRAVSDKACFFVEKLLIPISPPEGEVEK